MQFLGSAGRLSGRLGQGRCSDAKSMMCLKCGYDCVLPCGSSSTGRCRPCGLRYKRKVENRCERGLVGIAPDSALELTWTAPGSKRMCGATGHRGCDGTGEMCAPYDFVDSDEALAGWHSSLTERRNRFLTALRRGEACKKVGGRRQLIPDLEYFEGREVQDGSRRPDHAGRGALHGHMLLRRSSGAPFVVSERLLGRLLVRHGFGRKFSLKPYQGRQAASYITKRCARYVSKSVDSRGHVLVLNVDGSLSPWRGRLWVTSKGWSSGGAAAGPGVPGAAGAPGSAVADPLVSFTATPMQTLSTASHSPPISLLLAAFPGSEVVSCIGR